MTPKGTRTLDIGVMLSPGAMRSAVVGLQELMVVANGKQATLAMLNWPQFDVSLWSDNGASQRAFAECQPICYRQQKLDVNLVPSSTSDKRPQAISSALE